MFKTRRSMFFLKILKKGRPPRARKCDRGRHVGRVGRQVGWWACRQGRQADRQDGGHVGRVGRQVGRQADGQVGR